MLSKTARYALVAALLAVVPAVSGAASDLGDEWQDRLRKIDRQIRKGRHVEAETAVREVIRQPDATPAFAYCALEALRAWRFGPATLVGNGPVAAIYRLAVNFWLEEPDD